MNFADRCPQVETPFRVTASVVQLGGTTWQLKNIASVRIVSEPLVLAEPEPRFTAARPRRTFRTGLFLILVGVSFLLALQTMHLGSVFLLLTLVSLAAVFAVGHFANVNAVNEWTAAKAKTERRAMIWKAIAARRDSVHRLVFDTASGQNVALAGLDATALRKLQDTIIEAMGGSTVRDAEGQIRVINTARKSPEAAYADYCDDMLSK